MKSRRRNRHPVKLHMGNLPLSGLQGTAQDRGLRDHLDALLALMGEHHDQSAGRAREMETSNTTQLHPCEQYCSEMHEAEDQYRV
jgi:hypothetical protein